METIDNNATEQIHLFAQNDPFGVWMAILGMGIVFLVLILLYIVFSSTSKLYTTDFKSLFRKVKDSLFFRKKTMVPEVDTITQTRANNHLSGEESAAIAAAIYLYRTELHDYQNTALTINKVSKTYSPWSSKIYGLRKVPR
ncbi:MAG: OadG family protein [Bacteroidota bacterium]